jgi:hypothetical protein
MTDSVSGLSDARQLPPRSACNVGMDAAQSDTRMTSICGCSLGPGPDSLEPAIVRPTRRRHHRLGKHPAAGVARSIGLKAQGGDHVAQSRDKRGTRYLTVTVIIISPFSRSFGLS